MRETKENATLHDRRAEKWMFHHFSCSSMKKNWKMHSVHGKCFHNLLYAAGFEEYERGFEVVLGLNVVTEYFVDS